MATRSHAARSHGIQLSGQLFQEAHFQVCLGLPENKRPACNPNGCSSAELHKRDAFRTHSGVWTSGQQAQFTFRVASVYLPFFFRLQLDKNKNLNILKHTLACAQRDVRKEMLPVIGTTMKSTVPAATQ